VDLPRNLVAQVTRPETCEELDALQLRVQRGCLFGEEGWVRRMAKRFGLESTCALGGARKALEH
jgi:hypothetical protein